MQYSSPHVILIIELNKLIKEISLRTYFVILCWNNQDLLEECITSIRNQRGQESAIIMVDNGSTDKSVDLVRKNFPEVKIIEAKKNNGFAIGNNIGIKLALEDENCEYVALINTDATLDKDWLKTLIKFAEQHPDGSSFQTPTLDYYDHTTLDSRGITIDHQGRAVQLGYRETYIKRDSHEVFGVNAAAALYSARFLREQPFGDDYFDSDLWMYLEDVDLAARAVLTGWKNWYVDGSFAYHMGSASSSKNPGFAIFHIYRNNGLLLLKNIPTPLLLRILPSLIITDIITLLQLLRGRNVPILKKIVKARLISLRMSKVFLTKRKTLMDRRKLSNGALWALMGIS